MISPNHPAIVEAYRRGLVVEHGRPSGMSSGSEPDDFYICVTIPIKTVSRLNAGGSMKSRISRPKREREATALALMGIEPGMFAELARGCIVRMSRLSASELDDDNLSGALKSVRDQVAIALLGGRVGQFDNDRRIKWVYDQIKAPRGVYGVIVTATRTDTSIKAADRSRPSAKMVARSEKLPLPAESTSAQPGSDEKIRVLRERVARGEKLFHPSDKTAFAKGEQ